ncbi:MAG: choice-of-anchor I family protein [Trichodesmium sp. MO_231.B1]|nr:choice-of-anchor I family protein [Trichodesmium sp. MO_231.B1]
MKNHQGKSKYTNTNVLGKMIKLTVESSFAVAMMAAPSTAGSLSFTPVATNFTGIFDDGAALHTAHDPMSQTLFKVNDSELKLEIFDITYPSDIDMPINSISLEGLFGGFEVGGINDVAYSKEQNIFAVAVENDTVTDDGIVAFFKSNGELVNFLTVGALPDFLTFTADGSKLLVANEGEANAEYTIDPEGSVGIIDMSNGVGHLEESDITFAGFEAFNDQKQDLIDQGVRIFGPSSTEPDGIATVAQDFEPESIAVSGDGTKAYVALQENNALAILDIDPDSMTFGKFTDIVALGFKDHSLVNNDFGSSNGLDASDRDDGINIDNYPIFGMFQPDEIASYEVGGKTYLVTANEGSGRDEVGFSEEVRVEDLTLDEEAFGGADEVAELQKEENLGRLIVTNTMGDTDGDGDFDELYAFGGRSFSIWDEYGRLVFDSGDEFEQITAELFPDDFNSNNDENNFDNRSDNKGPEPEGVAIGQMGDRTLAFIGLERIGGFMTYDVSNPLAPKFMSYTPKFMSYTNNRDFSVEFDLNDEGDPDPTDEQLAAVGDLGPEGLTFISAEDSPNDIALLVVANEVSGTTTIYEMDSVPEPGTIFGLLAFGATGKLLLKRKSKTTQEQEKA